MGKKPSKPAMKLPPSARALIIRRVLKQAGIALVLGSIAVLGFYFAQRDVAGHLAYTNDPPEVMLLNRPGWMTDEVAEGLSRLVRPARGSSAFDEQVLRQAAAMLQSSPWVKHVNAVRRAYRLTPGDTIEIDCDFRAPLALVRWQDYYWLVDSDGYKLPEQYTAEQTGELLFDAQRRTQLRVIEGVQRPPVETGQKWPGDDLAAGLELTRLLYGQRYADEVVKIDVANFGGRVDPRESQLTLVTKYGSEIRWGRPIGAKDAFVEIPPARKLEAMSQVFAKYSRVDANQPWLDIRFDQITYPSAQADTSR